MTTTASTIPDNTSAEGPHRHPGITASTAGAVELPGVRIPHTRTMTSTFPHCTVPVRLICRRSGTHRPPCPPLPGRKHGMDVAHIGHRHRARRPLVVIIGSAPHALGSPVNRVLSTRGTLPRRWVSPLPGVHRANPWRRRLLGLLDFSHTARHPFAAVMMPPDARIPTAACSAARVISCTWLFLFVFAVSLALLGLRRSST